MPEFAEFSPSPVRLAPLATRGLEIREATRADLDAVALISARRQGSDVAEQRAALEHSFGLPGRELSVAVFESAVIGFGRSSLTEPPPDAPPNAVPGGWYLGGLVVSPEFRRRGVGHELTRHRLDRLFAHASRVYYIATAINAPTIALHERLGFREIATGIWAPGTSFTGGVGLLFELRREDYSAAAPAPLPG